MAAEPPDAEGSIPDDVRAQLDAEAEESDRQSWLQTQIARKADDLRILEAARARVQAEKATDTNFADLYLDRLALDTLETPEPLIERVIPRHSYGILRGRDQSLKSFVAIDWACSLATGKTWQGHDTPDPVRVLYIAGEGAHGLRSRIDAWEYAWQRSVPANMLTVRATALNLHQPGPAFPHLLEHVTEGGYGLVIVDTLRRVSGAADGNSSEMGLVIDNLDKIKQATDRGSVLTVAHTDKGDHDTRGYSGIEDDADFVWSAKRDDMTLALELTKMKDGADGRILHLTATRTLGSLTLSHSTRGTTPTVSNEHQLTVLDALRYTFRDGARPADLREATGMAKATLARALAALEDLGQITNTGTKKAGYWEIPPIAKDGSPTPEPSETPTPEDHHE
ncbi:AAA family ATPase [Nocardioides sp. SOB44]|uniref:AAA family ATPase n=1 Tax=Nocardioides cremeus TaxID=3058044 RepID=A0ABT8TSR4_9ACTN|nr:AAA family ATPase [Nocardioides cremeus]MDO3396997.1 AAA family ATPase [Nocardioides cremeus]